MTDLHAYDHGTVVIIEHASDAGAAWIADHVEVPAWARTDAGFIADHGPARDIIEGAHADGLAVEVTR